MAVTAATTTEERQRELPLLRMERITKSYGATRALRGVDFDCRAGEIHAIVGENGAGKSTLLKVLSGAVPPDGGRLLLAGEPVEIGSPREGLRRGIAMVHQELSVLGNLTVAENLLLGREPTASGLIRTAELRDRARRLLDRFGLPIGPDVRVDQLEVAERQAVEICKALAIDARIVVLDEPTAALGEQESERLFALLRTLRDQGLGIVYVSHRLKEVLALSDRITVLRNGERTLSAARGAIDEDGIVRAMVGRDVGELFPPRRPPVQDAPPALVAEGLAFGDRLVGVDLAVAAGEVVGVTGVQGAGQRTLARLVAGVLAPTGGRMQLAPGRRGTRAVAYVPEDRKSEGLALDRPIRENLTATTLGEIANRLGLLSLRRERCLAHAAATRVALRTDIEQDVRSLSGGNQQKALIGRCLVERPLLLVLEEPTRGVDVGARADIYRTVGEVAAAGTGVLVVSSDLIELTGWCDRVLVLREGQIVAELVGKQIGEDAIVRVAQGFDVIDDGAPERTAASREARRGVRWVGGSDATIPLLALLLMVLVGAIGADGFLTGENLQNLARQSIIIGLIGLAQFLVILTGGIDLSIGAVVAFTNLISTDLLVNGHGSAGAAIALAVAGGMAIGLCNGTLVRLGVPAFLATFAMLSIVQGINVWRYPKSVGPVPRSFWTLNSHETLGIPTAFLALVAITALVALVLRRTRAGRAVYAVGEDEHSARITGLPVWRVRVGVFVAAGLLAGLAGAFVTARVGAGLSSSGTGLELDAIAVVMIGGASLAGGRGTVLGTVAGVGVVTIISNLFNLWDVDAFYQYIVKGLLIVAVATLWVTLERRRRSVRAKRRGATA